MFALAVGLFGLIVLLATLQYRWLGQISAAERTRVSAMLRDSASAFAADFDRELNRAYLLFQIVPAAAGDNLATQVGSRYDRWMATSLYPRVVRDVYLYVPSSSGGTLQRFNPATRFLEPAEWPASLAPVRARLGAAAPHQAGGPPMIVRAAPALWPDIPALVVTAPMVLVDRRTPGGNDLAIPMQPAYCLLLLDSGYIRGEMLPALARQHFRSPSGGFDYELAVVPATGRGVVYHSVDTFNPEPAARADASADLFHLRVQDFEPLVSEISRFAVFSTQAAPALHGDLTARTETVFRHTVGQPLDPQRGGGMSIVVRKNGGDEMTTTVTDESGEPNARFAISTAAHWRLLVRHPSGSLELAVDRARRRNLLISTGILGLLAVSVGFLVVSTRRAHDLARQQLEFVATVSHELRTPLAVIRSAADNLADGVVGDEARVRQYGQLVRREGIRLTTLVEQILEFAGLQSGQRAITRQPLAVDALLQQAIEELKPAASAAVTRVELSIADDLPAVCGDEAALRRVFVNLIGNAIKYGASARWVGVRARPTGDGVEVGVTDRGIGIAADEQDRIFEPFYRAPAVVAAQVQGAGLGLSLVKRIVEAHGGVISVESAPGHGTTFTVKLPADRGDLSASETSVGAAAPQHS
jgi:signal transduction histidine kinase